MSETQHRLSDIAKPRGFFEKACAGGQTLPGKLGRICYRKLKRRIGGRTQRVFGEVVGRLGPGDIAVDLGANVGTVTERFAATGATVHAFEPDSGNFSVLRKRFENRRNVILHDAAAGGRDGSARILRPPSYGGWKGRRIASEDVTIVPNPKTENFVPGELVSVVNFANFLKSLPKPAAIVKVDIEGAEWELLDSVEKRALDRFETMFVETHETNLDWSMLPRARALQKRFARMRRPYINLYWW